MRMSRLSLMRSGSNRFATSSSGMPLNRKCFFRGLSDLRLSTFSFKLVRWSRSTSSMTSRPSSSSPSSSASDRPPPESGLGILQMLLKSESKKIRHSKKLKIVWNPQILVNLYKTLSKQTSQWYLMLLENQLDWIKIVDVILIFNFWECLIFFDSDFRSLFFLVWAS